jgi:hypothetical protein
MEAYLTTSPLKFQVFVRHRQQRRTSGGNGVRTHLNTSRLRLDVCSQQVDRARDALSRRLVTTLGRQEESLLIAFRHLLFVDHQSRAALYIPPEVNRMPRPITEQIQGTYFRLRFTVAIIGLLFPVILYFGGRMNHFGLRGSMSAYYWATQNAQCPCGDDPEHSGKCKKIEKNSKEETSCLALPAVTEAGSMRSYFVGLLFAVGAILYANKGYSRREDIFLNIAGVSAWLIALFPMPWTGKLPPLYWVHWVAATIFFLAIASVAAFCSHATVGL